MSELEQFREIFTSCNRKYWDMLDTLKSISKSTDDLNDQDKSNLTQYFNLCAEEYLYYKKYIIPSDVWNSWSIGMKSYITSDERIKEYWLEEVSTDSYYGIDKALKIHKCNK
ncbi:hypothetical protein OLEAN_C33930 [Oleispira antarctica RB-8]|uniref:Uncharacterized protein n=1 Tax=Oleispira antarctica RB-8 TaxID=698738 RepID=R4YV47_OLEAN|nr:hypothetical protein OLEAN_C33930 [Oleispira antarctica RB-8]